MERVPAALWELLVGGAEGNAFFLEQLIKVAIEAGVISKGEDDLVGGCGPAWRPAGAADAERVLQANGDPRAASVLDTAHELLL